MKTILKSKWTYLVILAAGAWWYFQGGSGPGETIEYQTAPLSTGTVESIVNSTGTLSPISIVEVGSEVSGLISEMNADFNSTVQAGDLLARIDDRDVRIELRQREADLEVARANLVQEKAALIRAETDFEFSQNELERTRSLLDRNLVSETELETATSRVRSAEASLENAKARIISAQANILQREAQLEQAQLDLERTYIRSPVDGIVINRLVDLGQAVSANQSIPTLFEVAQDLSRMQIEAAIDEADIGKIKEDQEVRFRVDAYPDERFRGSVAQVRKSAGNTNNVVTYTIIIDAENPDETLLPGMTASVDIVLGSRRDVLRAPNASLRFQPPETAVQGGGSDPRGGFAGGAAPAAPGVGSTDELVAALNLEDEQTERVTQILSSSQQEIRQAMERAREEPWFDRSILTNLRSKMENELKLHLSPEQFAKYKEMTSVSARNAGGMERGTLWVLRDGQPVQLSVMTGLSDSEFTEIQTADLQPGDEVITRAAYLINE